MAFLTPPQADTAVRAAGPGDAQALGSVQAAGWRTSYSDLLPPPLLEAIDPARFAEQWQQALEAPPSPRHRVLVATAAGSLVGFAAVAPPEDADAAPDDESELTVLVVDPAHRNSGHGSRLMSAVADTCRDEGVRDLLAWVFARDAGGRAYLERCGWGADGATRILDADVALLAQLRLRTALT